MCSGREREYERAFSRSGKNEDGEEIVNNISQGTQQIKKCIFLELDERLFPPLMYIYMCVCASDFMI